ncbi:Bicoid-interacting protein 3-domain-containing protein [Zopfochytrium polystomum]|nr:Bicoid-interacting protein 3-domain-containing protein [Zopfochytrium polystomum]
MRKETAPDAVGSAPKPDADADAGVRQAADSSATVKPAQQQQKQVARPALPTPHFVPRAAALKKKAAAAASAAGAAGKATGTIPARTVSASAAAHAVASTPQTPSPASTPSTATRPANGAAPPTKRPSDEASDPDPDSTKRRRRLHDEPEPAASNTTTAGPPAQHPTTTQHQQQQQQPRHPKQPAAPYGNYPAYHGRRQQALLLDASSGATAATAPSSIPSPLLAAGRLDPRLALLDPLWFRDKRVLDVGCNAGVVAVALAALCAPRFVLGLDIDPEMVRRARAHAGVRASLKHPRGTCTDGGGGEGGDLEYFPLSAPAALGSLPAVWDGEDDDDDHDDNRRTPRPFPHNVAFRCADFVTAPAPVRDADRFDAVLALSVTKWVHVHAGDAGLALFFRKCHAALRRDGVLLLEPQPWGGGGDGYARARKKAAAAAAAAAGGAAPPPQVKMEMRPEDFADFLVAKVGFRSVRRLGQTPGVVAGGGGGGGFKREMLAFVK